MKSKQRGGGFHECIRRQEVDFFKKEDFEEIINEQKVPKGVLDYFYNNSELIDILKANYQKSQEITLPQKKKKKLNYSEDKLNKLLEIIKKGDEKKNYYKFIFEDNRIEESLLNELKRNMNLLYLSNKQTEIKMNGELKQYDAVDMSYKKLEKYFIIFNTKPKYDIRLHIFNKILKLISFQLFYESYYLYKFLDLEISQEHKNSIQNLFSKKITTLEPIKDKIIKIYLTELNIFEDTILKGTNIYFKIINIHQFIRYFLEFICIDLQRLLECILEGENLKIVKDKDFIQQFTETIVINNNDDNLGSLDYSMFEPASSNNGYNFLYNNNSVKKDTYLKNVLVYIINEFIVNKLELNKVDLFVDLWKEDAVTFDDLKKKFDSTKNASPDLFDYPGNLEDDLTNMIMHRTHESPKLNNMDSQKRIEFLKYDVKFMMKNEKLVNENKKMYILYTLIKYLIYLKEKNLIDIEKITDIFYNNTNNSRFINFLIDNKSFPSIKILQKKKGEIQLMFGQFYFGDKGELFGDESLKESLKEFQKTLFEEQKKEFIDYNVTAPPESIEIDKTYYNGELFKVSFLYIIYKIISLPGYNQKIIDEYAHYQELIALLYKPDSSRDQLSTELKKIIV